MSSAYTAPLGPTRAEAHTVNQPDPAPTSATTFPGAIPSRSITRSTCNFLSRSGYSKIDRSPAYGVLVGLSGCPDTGAGVGPAACPPVCATIFPRLNASAKHRRSASPTVALLGIFFIHFPLQHYLAPWSAAHSARVRPAGHLHRGQPFRTAQDSQRSREKAAKPGPRR